MATGTEVVLVRHGETEWSRTGRHTSHTDIALTDTGRRQAIAIGERLRTQDFARVLTSPLSRAADTCLLAGYSDVAHVTDDLREWDYGEYDGRTTADIRREVPGWAVWTHRVPGGETVEQVGERVDRVIELACAARGSVLLFGHAHALRVLGARWCGLPPGEGRLLALDPATVSVLGYERETAVIVRWNSP